MPAAGYFCLALLVLVLVPVVVLPWEGRRTPDWLYLLLAACGLGGAWFFGGPLGLAQAAAAALACLIFCGFMVTFVRTRTRLRILTGGQIKLLAAGATWLGLGGTLIMVIVAILALFAIAAFQRNGEIRRRPDASAVVAITIVSIAMQQYLPGM